MAVTDLTAQQNRMLQDYLPSLSDRTPGFDLAGQLQALIDEHQAVQTATATVDGTDTTVDVAFASVPTTAKIIATLNSTDGSTTHLLTAVRQTATTVRVTVTPAPGSGKVATVTVLLDLRGA